MKRLFSLLTLALAFLVAIHAGRLFFERQREFRVHESLVDEAVECLDARHWKCAEKAVKSLLSESPGDTNLQMHLAGILFEQGRYAEARSFIDTLSFSNADLKSLYEKSGHLLREAEELDIRNSEHFRLETEGHPSKIEIVEALNVLEIAYDSIAGLFDFFPEDKIPVVLYEHGDYKGDAGQPGWAFAVYDGKLRIPVRAMQDRRIYRTVFFHELTHAFTSAMSRAKIPGFANEGIALAIDGSRRGEPPPEGPAPSLEELRGDFIRERDADKVERLYFHSFKMVEALLASGKDRPFRAFRDFLFDLKALGTDASMQRHFGTSLEDLYRKAVR